MRLNIINRTIEYKWLIIGIIGVIYLSRAEIQAQNNIEINPKELSESDTIASQETNLEDFVITVKKEIITSDGSKLTYDLTNDDSTKGTTLLDALRKIPMVTVDGSDKIMVNGNSNFKIYVNGKEDQMLESNYSTIFKAMPSESVSKIEVISDPGAQYDAEGVGGIINLITEHSQKKDGYNGSLSLSYGSLQAALSGFITGKVDKFSVNGSLTYADNGPQPQTNNQDIETIYKNSTDLYRLVSTGPQELKFNFLNSNIDMSWEPTVKDLFNFGGSVMGIKGTITKFLLTHSMYNQADYIQWRYDENYKGGLFNLGVTAHASYRRAFNDDATHRLIIAYLFNFGRNNLNLDINTENYLNYISENAYRELNNTTYNREHTVQIDYSNPFGGEHHQLDAGMKGIFRRNSILSGNLADNEPENMIQDYYNSYKAAQDMDIYAAYLSYKGNFSKLTIIGGLRYEHTVMGMKFTEGTSKDFMRHLNDWVPNASIIWNFAPAHNIMLGYQMRIMRPSIEQVNPYLISISQTIAQIGNPDLSSAHSNIVSLSYSNYTNGLVSGNVKLSYSQVNNGITMWNYQEGETIVSSYLNIGKNRRVSMDGFLNFTISPKMSLAINGNVNYVYLSAPGINASNKGWSGSYFANWNYRGPWDLRFGVYGGQQIHNIDLQGYNKGWYYYGLSVGKDFLKDKKLNVTLNASNFFQTYHTWTSYTETESTITNSSNKSIAWNVSLTIGWSFGKLKDKVKKTGLDIVNDDFNKGESNGSGLKI